ncbi:hypothetical protein DFH09DRAFT_1414805 [Mycena vulgaris]|nr:hypothetical protein DFH09DRAFT_1414805 [Mycena vulgaris]
MWISVLRRARVAALRKRCAVITPWASPRPVTSSAGGGLLADAALCILTQCGRAALSSPARRRAGTGTACRTRGATLTHVPALIRDACARSRGHLAADRLTAAYFLLCSKQSAYCAWTRLSAGRTDQTALRLAGELGIEAASESRHEPDQDPALSLL